jgi:RNA polymerase sigma factor (sigma-70 family)
MAPTDGELLHGYAQRGSQDAFSEIVDRYVNLVYGAALRQVKQADLADDVAQAVFIILAGRAGKVPAEHLPGWLIQTARFCAKDAVKLRGRREYHERQAAVLKSIETPLGAESGSIDPPSQSLDEALSRLRPKESTAVAMRYLQNKSTAEVAAAMGITTDSAQKIIARSLVKLRRILSSKGVTLPSATAVGVGLLGWSEHTAPTALAGAISRGVGEGRVLSSAARIADHARRVMFFRNVRWFAAIVLLVVLLGGAAISIFAGNQRRPIAMAPAASQDGGFGRPFIELVGSRIKQTLQLDLRSNLPSPAATVTENQYIQIEWADGPQGGGFDSYDLTVLPAGSNLAGAGQALWRVSGIRPNVRTVVYGSAPAGASAEQASPLKAGEYVVAIGAVRSTAGKAEVIRQAILPFKVERYPLLTVIAVRDAEVDGTVHTLVAIQGVNTSSGYAPGGTYTPPSNVVTREIDDADGVALPFEVHKQGDAEVCQFNFKQPIAPGEAAMFCYQYDQELHESAEHTVRWLAVHPAGETSARRFELFRLPPGAAIVSTSPANLARRTVDGRVQVFAESESGQKMPTTEIVYRVAGG